MAGRQTGGGDLRGLRASEAGPREGRNGVEPAAPCVDSRDGRRNPCSGRGGKHGGRLVRPDGAGMVLSGPATQPLDHLGSA